MKYLIIMTLWTLTVTASAQAKFPLFLEGTWKMENREIYERWDKLNDNSLKGFSFTFQGTVMTVSEYLDIALSDNRIVYTASVLNQNQGEAIGFTLTKSDSIFAFENPNHDFPKKIEYQVLSDTELMVKVSDGGQEGFSYLLVKQLEKPIELDTNISNPDYDHKLARKLGADDYGMKSYMLVILKTGPNKTTDNNFISDCFRGHLDNINRLVKEGKMIIAGPMSNNSNNYRGIFILNSTSVDEVEGLLQTDPAIKEGLLDVELYNWYGSAALPEYLKYSERIWKIKPN